MPHPEPIRPGVSPRPAIARAPWHAQDGGMRWCSSIGVLVAFALTLGTAGRATLADGEKPPPPCVSSWPEARYVIGYDHIVHLFNACQHDATCTVSTDVNPAPQIVAVPSRTHVQVVTFLGSPVARFTPKVSCLMSP